MPICEEEIGALVIASIELCIFILFGKQFLQFLDAMAAGEVDKTFAAIALCEIDLKNVLQQPGQFVKGDTMKNLARDGLFFSETATENHVVTFDRITALLYLRPKQADIAHVMLSAGIRAAGQMNVNWLIELQFLLQMARQEDSLPLRVS